MARTSTTIFDRGHTPVTRRALMKAVAANAELKIPGGARIVGFWIKNTTANAVTGGIRVGSAAAGTQHLVAGAVAASVVVFHPAVNQVPIVQTNGILYIEAVTGWNSASLDIVVEYEESILPTYVDATYGTSELGRN